MSRMITQKRVAQICSLFKEKRILIFGDIILDRYIFGGVHRISPEAPVPVVKVEREEFRLGGAGNVAANIDKLGARALLTGIAGSDIYAGELKKLKPHDNFTLESAENKTLVKTRVIAQRQQIVRIDREEALRVTPEVEEKLLERVNGHDPDGIIISDYAKGTLTPGLMEGIKAKAAARDIPLVVDPKPPNFHLYRDIDGITPNLKEAQSLYNKPILSDGDAAAAARFIRRKFGARFSVVTRGDKGITAVEKGKRTFHIPAFSHEVFDVTGAGDTVISVLALALVSGANLKEALLLSNAAASIVVEKIGTSQVTVEEIQNRVAYLLKSHIW